MSVGYVTHLAINALVKAGAGGEGSYSFVAGGAYHSINSHNLSLCDSIFSLYTGHYSGKWDKNNDRNILWIISHVL